ncbi:copper resistance protein CopC/CopD [Paenibacillus doosanensis]|uniref:Copper transport protein YcnJ n=1 Tax=Paenibacillus konkukensis TaxID=2020716 RepID=A0ABY4RX06_9BACL|nr:MULTISPECIES: copper resistance protein CopC [Paenibacillus]MCS7460754.1 copper resistance protein CopC/CopD [Paenibacillus doosanensis]UQZ85934.1 Copper transport protein YcnJ precursor [Paenibacillus konkukensis]
MKSVVYERLRHAQSGRLVQMLCCLILLLGIGFAALPEQASAHATLVSSSPASGAELDQAPERVELTFNERLEDGIFYIKVFDNNKKQVTENKARMNETRTTVSLDLPKLSSGSYLVTYHIISADGHPVEGTYLFAVGQSLSQQPIEASPTMQHLHSHGLSAQIGFVDIMQFISRILYYALMLAFCGWLLWLRFGGFGPETLDALKSWGTQLQRGYLLAFLFFMFTHVFALIGDGGPEALTVIFTQTWIGYVWMVSLLLSLLSFVVLHRSLWLDLLWVGLICLAKSLNGHAAAFEPLKQTLLLDMIHLAAASLWVGGLWMLLVLWRKRKEDGLAFFPRFSGAALASILLLTASGILSTVIFLPDIEYVLETQWGKLLLAKSALVVLVVITAGCLRFVYRKRGERKIGLLLRTDAVLSLLIVAIVGVFTYLTPLPANEPLNWHVMGDKIHMTAQITPNVPGVNEFTVKVWLPEPLGKPKQMILKLHDAKSKDIAPIEVPLEYAEDNSIEDNFGGLKKYTYKASGAYLPYPGYWDIEVRVMDSNDDETVYDKQIRLY